MPIEDIDFILVSHEKTATTAIKLLTGKFAGALYVYGPVRLMEDPYVGTAKLSYSCEMITRHDIANDSEFHLHAGKVLHSLLSSPDAKIGKMNGN